MKSLLEITTSKDNFRETLDSYIEEGFEYVSSSENNDTVTIIIKGDIHNLSQYSNEYNKSYLEFEDGSRSPLYIKRDRNFWED